MFCGKFVLFEFSSYFYTHREIVSPVSRHLLHNLAIKHFAVGMFVTFDADATPGAPLFEEEGGSVNLGRSKRQ